MQNLLLTLFIACSVAACAASVESSRDKDPPSAEEAVVERVRDAFDELSKAEEQILPLQPSENEGLWSEAQQCGSGEPKPLSPHLQFEKLQGAQSTDKFIAELIRSALPSDRMVKVYDAEAKQDLQNRLDETRQATLALVAGHVDRLRSLREKIRESYDMFTRLRAETSVTSGRLRALELQIQSSEKQLSHLSEAISETSSEQRELQQELAATRASGVRYVASCSWTTMKNMDAGPTPYQQPRDYARIRALHEAKTELILSLQESYSNQDRDVVVRDIVDRFISSEATAPLAEVLTFDHKKGEYVVYALAAYGVRSPQIHLLRRAAPAEQSESELIRDVEAYRAQETAVMSLSARISSWADVEQRCNGLSALLNNDPELRKEAEDHLRQLKLNESEEKSRTDAQSAISQALVRLKLLQESYLKLRAATEDQKKLLLRQRAELSQQKINGSRELDNARNKYRTAVLDLLREGACPELIIFDHLRTYVTSDSDKSNEVEAYQRVAREALVLAQEQARIAIMKCVSSSTPRGSRASVDASLNRKRP